MVAFDYIPFRYIFPHAAAIVLHGGIGTLAEALRSGRPMLIVPVAHDQPDNAQRAKELNIARCLQRTHYKADRVAQQLSKLLTHKAYEPSARHIQNIIQQEQGIDNACDVIEETLDNISMFKDSNSEKAETIISEGEKML
jgi:UDP:flavonoid glycosyltransferase YjiC (YdhE family)